MKLSDRDWKEFFLEDIFSVGSGKRLTNADKIDGTRPFIGATDNMNGVTGFVDNENSSLDNNVLGVNYNGAPCIGFYHPYECIFTDDVKRLHLKNHEDNQYVLLFFKTIILQQKNKYCYGYKFNERRMLRQIIVVPVDDNDEPDYQFMEDYIKELMVAKRKQYQEYVEKRLVELSIDDVKKNETEQYNLDLESREWKIFIIGDLFTVKRPIARNKDQYENGNVPFVASGSGNNGVMKCCKPHKNEELDNSGCITVSPVDGSVFYQPYDFLGRGGAGSSILMLYADNINLYNGQFFAKMIANTCACKYTYGHMGNKDSIKCERIMLPVNDNGEPDYEFMEECGRKIMAKKYKQYLAFLEKTMVA